MSYGIFAVVLAAHVSAMLLLCFAARRPRTVVNEPTMTAAIIVEDRKAEVAEETRPPPLRSIPFGPEAIPPKVDLDDAPSPPLDGPSSAITDFAGSAHAAAEDIVRRSAPPAFRSLNRQIQAAPEIKRERSVFGLPEHAATATEHFDDGERYYVSGNCFYDFARAPPPALDLMAGPRLKVPTCKPPPSGNDEMFKDLTPEALKRLPAVRAK